MKNYYGLLFTCLLGICVSFSACDKDPIEDFTAVAPPLPPPIPPTANAGIDMWVGLPTDSTELNASYSYSGGAPFKYTWKQVSGPGRATIENPESMKTKVTHLIKGDYYFEFTVTNSFNLSGRDTVIVKVHDKMPPPTGEVIFNNQLLYCIMDCGLLIECFSCYVSDNKPFKIYIREKSGGAWLEALPYEQWSQSVRFFYEIIGGNLLLTTYYETNSTVDVKIVY